MDSSPVTRSKQMVHDLLDFKANWREVYDHFQFRGLTSNQDDYESELTWISNFEWRKCVN